MTDVRFRGPMLFMTNGQTLKEVHIPNGTGSPKHPDDDDAVPHYAGLMLANLPPAPATPDDVPADLRFDLRRTRVTIDDGTGEPCRLGPTMSSLVDLKELTDQGANNSGPLSPLPPNVFFGRGASIVTLIGGQIEADAGPMTNLTYNIPGTFSSQKPNGFRGRIPTLVQWTPSAESTGVTLTVAKPNKTVIAKVTVDDDQSICIYHWDETPLQGCPTPEKFMTFGLALCARNRNVLDLDFKWAYEVLTPASNWQAWLGGNKLPAPISVCSAVAVEETNTGPGRDCLAARWEV